MGARSAALVPPLKTPGNVADFDAFDLQAGAFSCIGKHILLPVLPLYSRPLASAAQAGLATRQIFGEPVKGFQTSGYGWR